MSALTAWCPALLSLGQLLAKAGYMERLMRLMVAQGTDERVLALHTAVTTFATVKLAEESDESASDVVVYGMHGSRPSSCAYLWRALLSCLFRPADGDGVSPGVVDALESHKQDIDGRRDAAVMMLEVKLTSQRQVSSFTAWFEAVFLCRIVAGQCSLVSLGQPTLKAGCMQNVPDRQRSKRCPLWQRSGEIDERASDVVVYGMVSDAHLSLSASRW